MRFGQFRTELGNRADLREAARTLLKVVHGTNGIRVRLRCGRVIWSLTFAFVATHNHFVLDRGGKVFKRSAPVIKLPESASEDDHLALLGVLNSSTACFWLKQVSHQQRGNGGIGGRNRR